MIALALLPPIWVLGANPDADRWRDRYEAQAFAGWQRLKQGMIPLAGSATSSLETEITDAANPDHGKRRLRQEEYRYWISDRAMKVRVDRPVHSGKGRVLVYGSNPDYAFYAEQTAQDGVYFVKECGRDAQAMADLRFRTEFLGIASLRTAYTMESDLRTLPEIFRSDGFQLVSCRELEEGGRNLVEVRFDFKPAGRAAEQDPSTRRSRIVLDPSADWRLVSSSTKRDKEESDLEVHYGSGSAAPGAMVGFTRHSNFGNHKSTERFACSVFSREPVPMSEFYLPSLGLPDCPGAPQDRSWRWFLVGGSFIAMGILLFIFYKRRKAQAARAKG